MSEPNGSTPLMDRIRAQATPGAIWAALLLYLATVVALTLSDARMADFAHDLTKPDLQFGYDRAAVLAWLTALGETGRRVYLWNLAIDSVMPLALAAATVLVAARAAPRWLPVLAIAPMIFLVLDLVENAALAAMVVTFPEVSETLVAATSPVTMVKLASFAVALPTLILAAGGLGVRWLRGRR